MLFNDLGQLSRAELEEIAAQVANYLRMSLHGVSSVQAGPLALPQPVNPDPSSFLALLTGQINTGSVATNGYNFAEVLESGGAFPTLVGGRTDNGGASPAYEQNGNTTVPANSTVVVRLSLETDGNYSFTYASGGNTNQTVGAGVVYTVAAGTSTKTPGEVLFTADATAPGVLVLPVYSGPATGFPASPAKGQAVYNPAAGVLDVWSGAAWLSWYPLPKPVQTSALVTDSASNIAWVASGANGQVLTVQADGSVKFAAAAVGTVTSVGLTMPAEFSVASSPVTSSGTLAVTKANQSANVVYAGPASGAAAAPTFRALTAADLPAVVTGALGETLSGLPTTPGWRKYTIPFNDASLNVAGTSATTTVCVLPAGAVLLAVKLYHTTQFAPLANLTASAQGSVNSSVSSYMGTGRTVTSAVADRPTFNSQLIPDGGQAGTLTAQISWTGSANLNTLNAGSLDVYLLVSQGG